MAPKKGEEPPKRSLLGRPGNNVKIGIVGLPNVGKSSLFNIMSKLSVAAENFPFCTIDPNVARVPVPDKRFRDLVDMFKPASEVPAMLTITDIAGLVKGASEGAGLGNAFLSHIRAVDGIFHVCRAFEDKEVTHVEDSVDPVRDLAIIHDELRRKDMEQCRTYITSNRSLVEKKVGGKEKLFEYETVCKVLALLEGDKPQQEQGEGGDAATAAAAAEGEDAAAAVALGNGKDVRACEWDAKEIDVLNTFQFLTAKPMIYLVNVSRKSFIAKGNKWLPKLNEFVEARGCGDLLLPFSVTFEQELFDAEASGGPAAKQKLMKEAGARTMIPKIIKSGYEALQLIHYFTAGKDEVRAWSVKVGTLAPKAAGVIHTDFEKGFISADVMSCETLFELGSETAVKTAGKLQQKGRAYEVQDGDIMHFKFNN